MRMLSSSALFAALSVLAAPLADAELSEKDAKALAKEIGAYFEAKGRSEGVAETLATLSESLAKLEKRNKGASPLAMVEGLGQAFWFAEGYDQKKGIKKGRVDTYDVEFGSDWRFRYALHAPKKYDPRRESYPVLLCIPEAGDKPEQHLIEDWIDPALRDAVILVAVGMPEDPAKWTQRMGGGVGNMLATLREIRSQYALDFDRVFLSGKGAGVAAAVAMAGQSPDIFAGVIGRAGDVGEGFVHENFANLPTFFAGAGANASAFESKVKEAGYGNCTLAAGATEQDVWAWMQQQVRAANPAKVVLRTGGQASTKAYWLSTPPAAGGGALLKAEIDREANTIRIEGEGAESVRICFNDLLVDLSKPVKVVCNGAQSEDLVPRSLAQMLDLYWDGTSDPGRIYTASRTYDLPAAASQGQ